MYVPDEPHPETATDEPDEPFELLSVVQKLIFSVHNWAQGAPTSPTTLCAGCPGGPGRRLTYGVAVAGHVPDRRLPYGK